MTMTMGGFEIAWSDALVWFDCARCKGTGIDPVRRSIGDDNPLDPDDCTRCGGMQCEAEYLGTFLQNLTIAAGLCAAFECGYEVGIEFGTRGLHTTNTWTPNAKGRPSPRCRS